MIHLQMENILFPGVFKLMTECLISIASLKSYPRPRHLVELLSIRFWIDVLKKPVFQRMKLKIHWYLKKCNLLLNILRNWPSKSNIYQNFCSWGCVVIWKKTFDLIDGCSRNFDKVRYFSIVITVNCKY